MPTILSPPVATHTRPATVSRRREHGLQGFRLFIDRGQEAAGPVILRARVNGIILVLLNHLLQQHVTISFS